MSNLCEILNKKIKVFSKEKVKNNIGQTTYEYVFLKEVWAYICPTSTKVSDYISETDKAEYNFKFILRNNSIKNISRDMYFIYNGQKYEIEYYIPNFKNPDRIELNCKLVIE